MRTPKLLLQYTQLQHVQLVGCDLEDVSALGVMQFITNLDLRHNKLRQLVRINPPLKRLKELDYSLNPIKECVDFSYYQSLEKLRLKGCGLRSLWPGLGSLPRCTVLDISKNKLRECNGIQALTSLSYLNLSGNRISSILPIACLSSIEVLHIQENIIKNLDGLQNISRLREINASDNSIEYLESISSLQHCQYLSSVKLQGNPMERRYQAREHTVFLLPQVTLLNDVDVSPEEKVHSSNLHGANAAQLRAIRKKYFPNGELDDGGGAPPPYSAGMEVSDGLDHDAPAGCSDLEMQYFYDIDRHARSVPIETVEKGVEAIADYLISKSEEQLDLARMCYTWVLSVVQVPTCTTQSTHVPLLKVEYEEYHEILCSDTCGTWAEQTVQLMVKLMQCCHIDAQVVCGIWRPPLGHVKPHERLCTHNHCWAAFKLNKRWRLVECVWTALAGPKVPFYMHPHAFRDTYFPLQEHWQLVPEADHMTNTEFWSRPMCHLAFWTAGCQLLSRSIKAYNVLVPSVQDEENPHAYFKIAVPLSYSIYVTLKNAQNNIISSTNQRLAPVAPQQSATVPLLLTQCDMTDTLTTNLAGQSISCAVWDIWASFPATGDYHLSVVLHKSVPNALALDICGIKAPIQLDIVDQDMALETVFNVPTFWPFQTEPISRYIPPKNAPMRSSNTVTIGLPMSYKLPMSQSVRLLVPQPPTVLEADRLQEFKVTSSQDLDLFLVNDYGEIIGQFQKSEVGLLQCSVRLPRTRLIHIAYKLQDKQAGLQLNYSDTQSHPLTHCIDEDNFQKLQSQGLYPALSMVVVQAIQTLQEVWPEEHSFIPDRFDPVAISAWDLFQSIDLEAQGCFNRMQLLQAIRKNRKIADWLKMPARVNAFDGTMEKFIEIFLKMDSDGLGYINFPQLAQYMGAKPAKARGLDDMDRSSCLGSESESAYSNTMRASMYSQYSRAGSMYQF